MASKEAYLPVGQREHSPAVRHSHQYLPCNHAPPMSILSLTRPYDIASLKQQAKDILCCGGAQRILIFIYAEAADASIDTNIPCTHVSTQMKTRTLILPTSTFPALLPSMMITHVHGSYQKHQRTNVRTRTYVQTHASARTHTNTETRMHAHTHTRTHTRTHARTHTRYHKRWSARLRLGCRVACSRTAKQFDI